MKELISSFLLLFFVSLSGFAQERQEADAHQVFVEFKMKQTTYQDMLPQFDYYIFNEYMDTLSGKPIKIQAYFELDHLPPELLKLTADNATQGIQSTLKWSDSSDKIRHTIILKNAVLTLESGTVLRLDDERSYRFSLRASQFSIDGVKF